MFIIGDGATSVDEAGTWQCGYVVEGSPGTNTYTLRITATNGVGDLTNVHVVVLINDAAHEGGLTQIVLSSTKTSAETLTTTSPNDFTEGTFDYGASGGPFTLSDYYGYNRDYTIQSLTSSETDKRTTTGYPVQAEITFADDATTDSKVYFLVYGTNAAGSTVKAPFSGGTLFVVPEYIYGGLVATAVSIGAFGVYQGVKKAKN